MSRERRVADLQTLLERVRRNAARPRVRSAPVAAVQAAAPVHAAAPVPTPAPEEGPSGWSEPPVEIAAPAAPEPERIALDSVSSIPPAEVLALPEIRESVPVPLLRVAADSEPAPGSVAPPPMLEIVAEPAAVPAHIEGAHIEAADDAPSMEDFTEDDIEEMSQDLLESVPPSVRPPAVQSSGPPKADAANMETFVEPMESEPVSSPRPIWAQGADGGAAAPEEREIPIKTPPPESGPQEALPANIAAPLVPEDYDQLEAEMGSSGVGVGPTPEQLGGVVDLVGPADGDLELDDQQTVPPPSPPSEFEVAIPLRSAAVHVEPAPAPWQSAPEPPAPPPWQPAPPPPPAVSMSEPGSVVTRPEVEPTPIVAAVPAPAPEGPLSFAELLDRALSL